MDLPRHKMKRREKADGLRFLTFSCYKQLPLLGTPPLRDRMVRSIASAQVWCCFDVLAWVIMPEHVHIMLRPDVSEFEVAAITHRIKKTVATHTINRWRELNAPVLEKIQSPSGEPRFWQAGGGFDRNPRTDSEILREIIYIHHNPVERKLVTRAIDWPWSSAAWYAGDHSSRVHIDTDSPTVKNNLPTIVHFLTNPPPSNFNA